MLTCSDGIVLPPAPSLPRERGRGGAEIFFDVSKGSSKVMCYRSQPTPASYPHQVIAIIVPGPHIDIPKI